MSIRRTGVLHPFRVRGTPLLIILGLSACAEGPARSSPNPVQPPHSVIPTIQSEPVGPMPWPPGPVPVALLVATAQDHHPTIAAVRAAQAAAAARVRQAAAWDHPELELSVGRTRPRQDGEDKDLPFGGSLSQRLTWWGTRNAHIAAARAEQDAVAADAAVARLLLTAEVRRAAVAYAVAVEDLALTETDARLLDEIRTITANRLAAGDADRAEAARVALEATTARIQVEARRRAATTAREVLGTWCDRPLPGDLRIVDVWDMTSASPAAAVAHPHLRANEARVAAATAEVDAQRGRRIPDLTVGVFAEREDEQDAYGLTLGIELPLWDRQTSDLASAEAARALAVAEAAKQRQALTRDLMMAQAEMASVQAEIHALETNAVPAADDLVRIHHAAFTSGDGGLSQWLDARRAANAVRASLLDARRRGALAAIDLGLAVGDPLSGTTQASRP